jgi:4-hydroxy-L-threonine phosphate dehydrogenase PdxA
LSRPLLAIVIGDPSGVGPEVCVKALATGEPQALARVVLIGSRSTIDEAARISGVSLPLRSVTSFAEARESDAVAVLDDGRLERASYAVGTASAAGGAASYAWIQRAIAAAEAGEADAIVIAPIDRNSWKLAGITGVTDEMHPPGTYLLRMTGNLRTIPIGEHVPFREIPEMVTEANVLHVIALIGDQMRRWGFASPRIAVAGLNPHANGSEDAEQIAPAVVAARARGFDVVGPLSPDTVFRAGVQGRYDVIVTMYHDQGQIAVKTFGLEQAATVFVGLPYVRVGIPHGSAFDVAGTGRAQHGTALTAMLTAAHLAAGSELIARR